MLIRRSQIYEVKQEVKHIIHNDEVPGKYEEYIFQYLTKRLKLKLSNNDPIDHVVYNGLTKTLNTFLTVGRNF